MSTFLNALIITGPTASGKTQLSEMIASIRSCEIINADVGQFYKPLSVGTAKPDFVNIAYKHHLFDLLDKPEYLSVVKYRNLVTDLVNDICARGKIPIIVGGSLFYIKSLFFPPQELPIQEFKNNNQINIDELDKDQQWELLRKIDPERAAELHQNDNYRINRALKIWIQTGFKPSVYKPKLRPKFNTLIVYVKPETAILKDRINTRTMLMINPRSILENGWIEEVEHLIGTDWEEFLQDKNLIGYPEIFEWIKAGKKSSTLPALIEKIQIQTVQYAKRQNTFWKSFERQILQAAPQSDFLIQIISVGLPNTEIQNQILTEWDKFTAR